MFLTRIIPGSNITLVKTHNLRAVLLSLLYENRVSRVELAEITGLSTTTITNLITELLEQGIVIEVGQDKTPTSRRVGRPRTALQLVPDSRYAMGVHIGVGQLRVALTNLHAQIVRSEEFHFSPEDTPEDVMTSIKSVLDAVIQDSGVNPQRIVGLGVGVSGLIDFDRGVNLLSPNLSWKNVAIREYLENQISLPVIVDNNVRAMALGEAFFGSGRGVNSLAFIYGRMDVGAGFIYNGQVYRGSNAGAGEIGHTIILARGGEPCRCGKNGCLETVVSETTLLRNAGLMAHQHPASLLAEYLSIDDGAAPIERVFIAARQGDPYAAKLVNQSAHYLGLALANLVNVFNPELIFLGGMYSQAEDLFLPVAASTMRNFAFANLGENVRVQTTTFGWSAGVIGAAALALTSYFY